MDILGKFILNYMARCTLIIFLFIFDFCQAQETDVQHYRFELKLNDQNDTIYGAATIQFRILTGLPAISFDLSQLNNGGKGMIVNSVEGTEVERYRQEENKIKIYLLKASPGHIYTVHIFYKGIPKDGLIISKNKYGDRTFFADNWPNRAHHWIPCNDRPDDKATFEFLITAPEHYHVIANGALTEEKFLPDHLKLTHWKEDVALPSLVMVIGVARFAVKEYDDSPAQIPITAWVYPQDSAKGFYDYGVAPGIVRFFSDYIAPFPYNKLANVQSKTIFGGMENASCIFYAEESVTGTRVWEEVLAHEIAHQWFGDMATEKTFADLWLSEGFATYLTDIYMEHQYGKDSANNRLRKERAEVIEFVHSNDHPVVDTASNLMSLLNANSYQKGGWVLHMLREKVGDIEFKKILQDYYQMYKGSNADTRDFERVAENVSGMNLKKFFEQWLNSPGIPELNIDWTQDGKKLKLSVHQATRKIFYDLTMEVKIITSEGSTSIQKVTISQKDQVFEFPLSSKAQKIILDPNTKLLFEQKSAD